MTSEGVLSRARPLRGAGIRLYICFGALLGLSSFGQSVNAEFDRSVDFTKFKTFYVAGGDVRTRNPALNSELAIRNLEFEIGQKLSARGLTQIKEIGSSQLPDLMVRYQLGADTRREIERIPSVRGRTGGLSMRVTEGTLVLELREAASKTLVWQAAVNAEEPSGAKIADKLEKMVKKAFEKYPPKK